MEPLKNIFNFFYYFIIKHIYFFTGLFILVLIRAYGQAYFTYYLKMVIDYADATILNSLEEFNIKKTISCMLFTLVVSEVAMRLNALIIIYFFPVLKKDIKFFIFKNCLRLPYVYFSNKLIGALCFKINEVARSSEKAYEILFIILQDILAIVFFATIISSVNKYIVLSICSLVAAQFYITIKSYKKIQYSSDELAKSTARCQGKMVDVFNSILLIKAQNTIKKEEEYFHLYQNEELISYKNYLNEFEFSNSLRALTTLIFYIFIFTLLLYKWQNLTLTAGEFSLVAIVSYTIATNIWRLTYQTGKLFLELGIASSGIKTLFNDDIYQSLECVQTHNPSKKFKKFDIIINDVYFKYQQSDHFIHKGLSLRICTGEKLAIIGKNGAGKSSLIKLLLGLYAPCKGTITIDNTDIVNMDHKFLSSQITFFPQKPCIFKRSIIDNILYLCNLKEDKVIKELVDIFELKEIIRNDFNVNSSIEALSEGQKHRIALCRTLAKQNAKIGIFDEPTSSIDPKMEKKIIDYIINIWGKEKTIIMVTHKETILPNFDRVVYLK